MSLTALNAALTGLRIAQQQIGVISNNVANVGTPGYTRKILPQSAQVINGQGVGVLAETIIRNVDLNLSRDLWTQISSSSMLDIKETYLNRIQQFHGPPDKELSIAAELAALQDSFAVLADSPEDRFLQSNTVNQAVDTANKINELSRLITTLRNDAQGQIETSVARINDLLEQVAELNVDISNALGVGRGVAELQDKRDEAIKELSDYMELSFFQRGDGVIVVQTNEGVELASNRATLLTFRPTPQAANTYYPASAAGVFVGDPLTNPGARDITADSPGGKLGGLLELRDETFPKQMAQLDELAHKMALRFEAQGLRLFTDSSGNIPADTPPDSVTGTPVGYIGFSGQIQVNQDILADNTLLQSGTYGASIASGSNEVIRRVLQFTFSDVEFQQAIGDIDIRVSALAAPNNTLQEYLGIRSENEVNGTRNLSSFLSAADFVSAANGELDPPNDVFRITLEEPSLGLGPVNIDVSLASVVDGAGNFVQDLLTRINTIIGGLPAGDQADLTAMNVTFSEGPNGQLRIESEGDITMDATAVANGMGEDGLALLGFAEGTVEATDPYFDVQVGNNDPVRITIAPDDDELDLQAKLLAVPGLAMEDIGTSLDGFLRLRPGETYNNPDFGGDIRIISGPFTTSAAGAGVGVIPNGINFVSALFGSFSTGPLQDLSAVSNVSYGSQTDGSIAPPIPTLPFRTQLLGPGANLSTNIIGATQILDYAQKIVNEHSQEATLVTARKADEVTLRETLQTQLMNDSAVNIDEELGILIQVQTAYTASARVITAVNQLFDDLLEAVR